MRSNAGKLHLCPCLAFQSQRPCPVDHSLTGKKESNPDDLGQGHDFGMHGVIAASSSSHQWHKALEPLEESKKSNFPGR